MGKSVIEDLYYCRRGNVQYIKNSEEYLKILNEVNQLYGQLVKILDEESRKVLKRLMDLNTEMEAEADLENFKEGLKIGILLGGECFGK